MATIKKPGASDSVTARAGPGAHPRGTGAQNRDRGQQVAATGPSQAGHGGKHGAGIAAGPDDLERDPGIDTPDSDRDETGLDLPRK